MEELVRLITNISVNTIHLSTEKIQDVLINSKKCTKNAKNNVEKWNKLAELLWSHIQNGLEKIDDQLLCATCFFSVIILTDKQAVYMIKMKEIIDKEIVLKTTDWKESSSSLQAVSLMYGMFQSSFLTQNIEHSNFIHIINSTFNLLILMGYEYSLFTFIGFKTMNAFKKVCGTALEMIIYSEENQIKLLNLVNHNWENPITGVRDLIMGIFQTLVNILSPDSLKSCIEETNSFYWNKARYLMLSVIIDHYKSETSIISESWIDGLINSLYKPGLVSAGADMYYAVLKKTHSENVWCKLFKQKVMKVLKGSSSKAIENFGNYWLLTSFKKFPQLMSILVGEFDEFGYTDNEYYSILFLMKQGNKLGILERHWDSTDHITNTEKIISNAIEHSNIQVRTLAFDILCFTQEKTLPSEIQFTLILGYLRNNINSDCTVLRINMLNSLNLFLTQLHILFRNVKDAAETENLPIFYKNLGEVVITSLNLNGNYQRKCTNVKMINVIIDCVSHIPKKRRDHVKSTSISLKEYLQKNGSWQYHNENTVLKLISLLRDPSDDIRDNVGKLLLNHYSEELRLTEMMNTITENAVHSMKSKFFFEICCGQSMFKLIVNLLLKEKHDEARFKSLDDVFSYGYTELVAEYLENRDILKSIEEGKQLHSFISILQVVLETCLKNSYRLEAYIEGNMNYLIEVLQKIANQFSWEQHNATSSDFSKLNEMVEDIIAKSEYNPSDVTDKDETKISGLHQIVLNCLWLNVKASCDLASMIINYYKDNEEMCEKCLNLITHALETSRHKGVIEGAGTALGCGIQVLTSLPEDAKTSQLPQTLLKAKLDMLIQEAGKMASITRRGAGLSIMVHRIVSSDMRKGKPLFHYFMKTLLKTCQRAEDVPTSQDIENQMDLPKAIFIHFLTKIVMDSSLASDMMFYSAELAELAFSNLTSSHWQIRNAALQLYGALIPRLIGQKKVSGTDDETIATVACDELRTHSPKLWSFITEQLENKSRSSQIISHSDLVPILNMLASCAKRYNFSSDMHKQRLSDEKLLHSLIRILYSPIHVVRRLTARCIFNIFSLEDICDVLQRINFLSENFIHGALMLMKCCHKYYNLKESQESTAKAFKDICRNVVENKVCYSYCSKEIYVSIQSESTVINDNTIINIIAELKENNNSPGVFKWAQTCIDLYLVQSHWEDVPDILKLFLNENDFEIYGEMLLCKIETQQCNSESAMKQIVNILLSFSKKYESSVIWKILYKIASEFSLDKVDASALLNDLENYEMSYILRYSIPFAAKLYKGIDDENQKKLAKVISKMSDFEIADVDMRYMAALANNELPKSFDTVSDSVKISSLTTAIILLQDEDEDVRNASVYYYKNIVNLNITVHPNICLDRMLDFKFLCSIFGEPRSIITLCKDLLQLLTNNVHNCDEYNPFANESKNIYLEVDVLRKTIENIMHHFK